jgi:regulator of cell morphogenesis and NO signaling
MTEPVQCDPSRSINEIIAAYPETITVFNSFGFDTCCGGAMSVDDAARQDGLDLQAVVSALNDVLALAEAKVQ